MTDDARWEDVKRAFQQAADLPPASRGALLDDICPDPDIRRDVESLLASHDRSAGFLQDTAADALAPPARDEFLGRRVGAYQVTGVIGSGGMGVVYLAARADAAFEMPVAIKIVKRGMDSADILRRFHEERQTLARLHHPNIATLLDGGRTDDGRPYLVMEYVRGTRVDRYCDERRLTVRERLRLFHTICQAVQHAHQNLIVHRDLKPDNILVTDDGVPKLIDFGIAKMLAPAEGGADVTTLVERRMTLAYASPEQVRGEPIGTASDVYSLGVILYELLSGHRPYGAPLLTPFAYERAIALAPKPPSTRAAEAADTRPIAESATGSASPESVARARQASIASLAKQLHGDLDTIVLKAMHREPDRRYASAEQLAEDLDREQEGQPVLARPDTPAYRTAKFIGRHRAGVLSLAVVLLALTGGLVFTLWQARVIRAERDRAQAEMQKTQQISNFLVNMLRSADPEEQGRNVTVAEALDRALTRADRELAAQPEQLAAIRTTIGSTYLQLGQIDKSVAVLERAVDIGRTLPGAPRPLAEALSDLAGAYEAQGRLDRAEAIDREALDLARRTFPAGDDMITSVMLDLSSVVKDRGALKDAEALAHEAIALLRQHHGEDSESLAQALNNLSVIVGTEGRWDEAVPLNRESLGIIRRLKGDAYPPVAASMTALASALEASGRYEEAETYFRQALALREQVLGPDHPSTAWTHYSYASMLVEMGQYARAAQEANIVLALRGRVLPDAHPIVAASLGVAGRAAMEQGDLQTAERELRESLKLREASLPPDHWLIASAKSLLGDCLTRRRQFAAAEPLLVQAYDGLTRAVGAEDTRTRTALTRLIALYDAWPRPADAARYRRLIK